MKWSQSDIKGGLKEVQTTYQWYVEISKPAEAVGGMDKSLQVRVQTTGTPKPNTETTNVELGGYNTKYNGKTTYDGELPWNFVEGTDQKVIEYFSKWVAKRQNPDKGTQEETAKLKANLKLHLLGTNDEVVRTYELIGALPKIDSGNEMGQGADVWMENITWEFDSHHLYTKGNKVY